MKKVISILLILNSLSTIAQIHFEKGYIIDNNGNKQEGYIKNLDWKNNPNAIEFKLDEDETPSTYKTEELSEFSVSDFTFKKFEIDIDRSSNINSSLSLDKNPVFKKETLLLQLLVEGNANLYVYKDKSLTRYFIDVNDNIEQLVYKKYMQNQSQIAKNNLYKQQLSQKLICQSLDNTDFENLTYSKSDMIRITKKYNTCKDPDYVYNRNERKGKFIFSIRPGITTNNFHISSDAYYADGEIVDFKNMLGFRLGVEVEYVFPINKNKWSLISEPTYNYVSSETDDFRGDPAYLDYNSFELPLGLRHHLFLNDNSKFYVNASLILVFQLDSMVKMFDERDFEFESGTNYAVGFGYKFKNKYAIEFQYKGTELLEFDRGTVRQLSKFDSMGLILGYSFL